MTIDEDALEKWKTTFAKDGIKYDSDEEYRDAIQNLVGFFEILTEIDQQQKTLTPQDNSNEMYLIDKEGRKIIL